MGTTLLFLLNAACVASVRFPDFKTIIIPTTTESKKATHMAVGLSNGWRNGYCDVAFACKNVVVQLARCKCMNPRFSSASECKKYDYLRAKTVSQLNPTTAECEQQLELEPQQLQHLLESCLALRHCTLTVRNANNMRLEKVLLGCSKIIVDIILAKEK
jgi:hypothetical protein